VPRSVGSVTRERRLRPDHQHVVEVAGGQHRRADHELVDEARAPGVEVETIRSGGQAVADERAGVGMSCSVVAVATTMRSMASGVSPAFLIAAAPASVARLAVVSPGDAIRRSEMPVRSMIH